MKLECCFISGRCQCSAILPVSPKQKQGGPKDLQICVFFGNMFFFSIIHEVYPSTGSISKLVFNEKLQELPT